MLKRIIVPPQAISAYMQDRLRIPLTVMSFDVNTHELVIPLEGVESSEIAEVIGVFTLKRAGSVVQVLGSVQASNIHIALPIQINRYKGRFNIEVDLRMVNNSTLTLVQFEAEAKRSEIDINNCELKPYYFALFDELVTEVQVKRTDSVEEISNKKDKAGLEIESLVDGVATNKDSAISKINTEVVMVENFKTEAKDIIDGKINEVDSPKDAAIVLITNKVSEVENSKILTIQSIEEKINPVELAKNEAIEEITDETNDAILDIEEQVRLTGLAKNEAMRNIDDKVELVETTKKAALTGINEQIESVESAKGLAIDAINDEKTLAIEAVNQAGASAIGSVEAAEGSAIGAVNQKVTNVDNAKKDAVTAIGEDVDAVSNLKTSALQSIAGDTQSASDSLGTINQHKQHAENAVIEIDDHLANTTAKNELVNQKFSEFDADITVAGQTIDEILALKMMNLYYDETLGEYVNLNWFYQSQKTGKIYTSEFYNYDVSPSSAGLKKDANADLIAEPSTNVFAGRDDYLEIGLFKPLDVNGYVDENDDYHITAIKGDGRFKADGSNGDVWVMNMTGFVKRFETETTWGYSYSDVAHPGFEVVPGGRKIDGTIRPFIIRAKYPAVRNPHDDNKLASISGQNPEYVSMSHNEQITEFKKKGAQYSGKTSHDDFWVKLMIMLKYASTNSDAVGNGCNYYYSQYAPAVLETDQSRFVVTNAQAATLIVGSRVSIGNLSDAVVTDRNDARLHNVRNRVKITSIEPLSDGVNTAINLDTTPFDTTSQMRLSTIVWGSGACDNVLGVDGSPFNGKSNKEPILINGIELLHGGYEVIQNLMIYNDNTDPLNYQIKAYICYDCKKYATSATTDYQLISKQIAQTNNNWQYIASCAVDPEHPSLMVPETTGATSSTGFGDGIYTNAPSTGYREWLSLGVLNYGLRDGVWCLYGYNSLAFAGWSLLGRLSATGRSRGERA